MRGAVFHGSVVEVPAGAGASLCFLCGFLMGFVFVSVVRNGV